MTVTYTDDAMRNTSVEAETFVPRYAQTKRSKKGPKTWMILAPIGALALIGGGAAMMFGAPEETQPLAEPAPIAPLAQPLQAAPAPLESSVADPALTPSTSAATPAPVVREVAPAPVVQRRAAPVERRAEPSPAVTPREEVSPEPTGPRPYTASPSMSAAPAPAVTPPAPSIQTAPLN